VILVSYEALIIKPKTVHWVLIALIGYSASCHANAGIGLFLIVLPLIVLTLPIVVLIETVYLRYRLKLQWPKAFAICLLANIISTLLGLVIGVGFDLTLIFASGSSGYEPTKIAASIVLLPMFYLTLRCEFLVWRWRDKKLVGQGLARALFAAHLLSYAVLFAFVWLHSAFLNEATLPVRVRLANQTQSFNPAKDKVADFAALKARLPKAFELPELPLDDHGRLSKAVDEVVFPIGTRMVLTPSLQKNNSVRWRCQVQAAKSQALDRRYLPWACSEHISVRPRRFGNGFE
jgi:glucan phosphoethanolaminetransferase (alkaline phosphatase superfamily)